MPIGDRKGAQRAGEAVLGRALNLSRRQLDQRAKREIIAAELRENPRRSNRWIAKSLGVNHETVGSVRQELESTGRNPPVRPCTQGADGKYRPSTRESSQVNGNGEHEVADDRDHLDPDDEDSILRAATEIRQRRIAERGRLEAEKQEAARATLKGKRTWALTDDPKVVRCDFLIADPPFGITDEPWEPEDVERFNREWSKKWASCGADFIAIFWCQDQHVGGQEVVRRVAQGLRVSADAHLARQQPVRSQEPSLP